MSDMAIFIGVFVVGYLSTMGLLYVVLKIFPKGENRSDQSSGVIMRVSRNPGKGDERGKINRGPTKMKISNG